jgi:hypothetical protein
MPYPLMPPIDLLCVNAVKLAHPRREIGLRSLDDEVVVIGHLTPGMDRPVVSLAALG